MKKLVAKHRWLLPLLAVLALATALAGGMPGCGKDASDGAQYYCPMHPSYVSDRPGDCPICNMRLVKSEKSVPRADSAATPDAKSHPAPSPHATTQYTCPMHPEVTSDAPGKCPKCGMPLELAKPAAPGPVSVAPSGPRTIVFYRNPMDARITSPVPRQDDMGMDYVPVYSDEAQAAPGRIEGLAPVTIDAEGRRLAGIQTARARREALAQGIRAVGVVVADETRVRAVQTKISGWIDKLYVNSMGQAVRAGQPILGLYSPELLAGQEEFLRALTASRELANASAQASGSGIDLAQAARRRLELFDVPASFIDTLERTGKVLRSVTLAAPSSGFVTTKNVFEGQRVEPGMQLFTVTDLSHVWIEADVYEYEAPQVEVGQQATLTLPYDAGVTLHGRVAYVYPYINPETRTLKVRFEFPNRDFVLKPAMYADVSLHAAEQLGIVVPESAVLDSGVRKVVFVETSPGHFEPREVRTGVRGDGKVQIVSGVQDAELVVVRANFLLDSESRLRSTLTTSAERLEAGR